LKKAEDGESELFLTHRPRSSAEPTAPTTYLDKLIAGATFRFDPKTGVWIRSLNGQVNPFPVNFVQQPPIPPFAICKASEEVGKPDAHVWRALLLQSKIKDFDLLSDDESEYPSSSVLVMNFRTSPFWLFHCDFFLECAPECLRLGLEKSPLLLLVLQYLYAQTSSRFRFR